MKITPAAVLEAYKQTGFQPLRGKWIAVNSNGTCACALSTLYLNGKDHNAVQEVLRRTTSPYESMVSLLTKEFEVEPLFIGGFVDGFDCMPPNMDDGAYLEGHKLGGKTYDEVLAKYEF